MRFSFALLAVAGCSKLIGIEDLEGPPGPGDSGVTDGGPDVIVPATECTAQRVVHLVGGSGGLAWFTLVWPVPQVITDFQPTFAYDNPQNAIIPTDQPVNNLLFVRRIGSRGLWEGTGTDPQPTAFVAGNNETHTQTPSSVVNAVGGTELVAAGAALQQSTLMPVIPVIGFVRSAPYGTAPGAPQAQVFQDVNSAVDGLVAAGTITAAQGGLLRPSAEQMTRYVPPGAPANVVAIAGQLAFTANAFKLHLVSTVLIPAFNDDPHGAFSSPPTPTTRADQLANILDQFYSDLATANESYCSSGGSVLSIADNTVMLVSGDTPKNSFENGGWPDGTSQNANFFYVRSNGFLKSGWFGSVGPAGARSFFSPTTGVTPSNDGASTNNTQAAYAAALYAIARGNMGAVSMVTNAPFGGTIKPDP